MLKKALIVLSIIFASQSLTAKSYTYKNLINKYLQTSLAVKLKKSQFIQSETSYSKTKSEALPKINLTLDKTSVNYPEYQSSTFFPANTYNVGLSVSQQLYLGGRIWRTISLSRANKDISKLNYSNLLEEETLNVLNLLMDLHLNQKKLALFKQSQKVQNNFLKITKSKFKKGNAKRYELEQAKSDYLSYFSKIKNTELAIRSKENRLSATLGLSDSQIGFSNKLDLSKISKPDLKKSVQNAIKKRKDYLAALKAKEVSELNKKITMGSHLPSLSVTGAWGYKGISSDGLIDQANSNSSIMIGLSIPLFTGFSSFKDRTIENENLYQADYKINQMQLDIKSQVQNAIINLKDSEQVYNNNTSWYKSADLALHSAKKSFKYGTIDNFQIVQLQRGRELAKINQLDSEFGLLKAILNFHYSVGTPLATVLKL